MSYLDNSQSDTPESHNSDSQNSSTSSEESDDSSEKFGNSDSENEPIEISEEPSKVLKKKFKCENCPKSYKSQSSLSRHMNVHKEKKFTCSVCEKKFTRIDHCTIHMLKVCLNKHLDEIDNNPKKDRKKSLMPEKVPKSNRNKTKVKSI